MKMNIIQYFFENFYSLKKNKVYPILNGSTIKTDKVSIYNDINYYELTNNIRNFNNLSDDEKKFISKLSKNHLIHLIEIYDLCIKTFRDSENINYL